MPYATPADMAAKFGDAQLLLLADRDGDGVADVAVIAQAIAEADGIVDLHVRGRYAVPLSPVDGVIVPIVCDIARRALYGNATEVPESVSDADKAARELLRQIAKGEVDLSSAPASSFADAGSMDVEVDGAEPFFTRDNLKGF